VLSLIPSTDRRRHHHPPAREINPIPKKHSPPILIMKYATGIPIPAAMTAAR
jgi:hypothetical protein